MLIVTAFTVLKLPVTAVTANQAASPAPKLYVLPVSGTILLVTPAAKETVSPPPPSPILTLPDAVIVPVILILPVPTISFPLRCKFPSKNGSFSAACASE